jgi:hypothetical protein
VFAVGQEAYPGQCAAVSEPMTTSATPRSRIPPQLQRVPTTREKSSAPPLPVKPADAAHNNPSPSDVKMESNAKSDSRHGVFRLTKLLLDLVLWTPRSCRYDPDNPPKFSLPMNMLMGLVGVMPSPPTPSSLRSAERYKL